MDAVSIFRTRRSIKPAMMDSSREVPREVLWELLEDAHRAPTHGLTQPWRFYVFTGSARARLATSLQELYDKLTPAPKQDAEKRAKLGVTPLCAPVVIAVVARIGNLDKVPEVEEIAATACAVQNLMLSAHARGIGSYWSTPPLTLSAEFARWLGLASDQHRPLGLVYLGYANEKKSTQLSPRNPLGEYVQFYDC